ncbi:PAS-domain containing protein [Marivibrio halodurans]|uniref:histidine kinase n=1 Tax=Marivibrio halodurans TaxID=2039722 RepID=A0A8J7SJP2_9PROT|nr:PAS-domain containing protein [Marivibrio halodurans]
MESVFDWEWETDENHRCTYISDSVETILGTSPGTFLGLSHLQFSNIQADPGAVGGYRADLQSRRPIRAFTFHLTGDDGSDHWCRICGVPRFDADGRFRGYHGYGQEVSEEINAQSTSESQNRLLANAVDSLTEPFALFDHEDRLVLSNKSFRDMRADIREIFKVGTPFATIFRHAVESGQFVPLPGMTTEEFIAWRIERHKSPRGAFELEGPNGSWSLVIEERIAQLGTVTIHYDLTERKKADQLILQAKNQAEQANQAKSYFLASMSHELRTPLNAIIGFADMIEAEVFGPIGNARYQEYHANIKKSGQHLLDIIETLLDLSCIESGAFDIDPAEIDLPELVQEVAHITEVKRHGSPGRVRIDIASDCRHLVSDARAIRQILHNLLTNGLKFSAPETPVTLTVRPLGKEHLDIRVSDQGIGIAGRDLLRITDPFARGRDAMVRAKDGVGLGLAISNMLAHELSGRLSIDSIVGKGTTVTVTLPRRIGTDRETKAAPAVTTDGPCAI